MAYNINAGGSDLPEIPRRYLGQDDLTHLCLAWISSTPPARTFEDMRDRYDDARRALEGRLLNATLLHSLLFMPMSNDESNLRQIFVSAGYELCPEKTIVYDLDLPEINFLAYRCAKPFVNKGVLGSESAFDSSCPFVNYGSMRQTTGNCSLFINFGNTVGSVFMKECVLINFDRKNDLTHDNLTYVMGGVIITPDAPSNTPQLRQYLQEMAAAAESKPADLLDQFGGAERIIASVRRLNGGEQ